MGNGNGPCVASLRLETVSTAREEYGSLTKTGQIFAIYEIATNWSKESVVSSGRDLDDQIDQFAQESIDAFVADVLSSKRSAVVKKMLTFWPPTEPMTQKQFQDATAKTAPAE